MPVPNCGKLVRLENFGSKYVDARHVDVWLPRGYDGKKRLPVLYMHDGQMLFDSAHTWTHQEWGVDESMCALLKKHKIRECIVVGIWNNGVKRSAEYIPQKAIEYLSEDGKRKLMDLTKTAPLADNYLKFIVLELKPAIDARFATLSDAANTYIAGSSMGGLISLYAICEYPGVFSQAACLSTHWTGLFTNENNPFPEAIIQYVDGHLPSPENHRLYFDHGTATLDSLYGIWQVKIDAKMKKKGFDSHNWVTKVYPGENHTETAWGRRLKVPLAFILSKRKR